MSCLLKPPKVLEYSLFQPGLFLNYFTYPHKSAEYFHTFEMNVDFQNHRAIVLGDGNAQISLTTVQDLGAVVAAAIDHEGEWPEVGGGRGDQITLSELIKLGENIRGELLYLFSWSIIPFMKAHGSHREAVCCRPTLQGRC
jgi:nucleoside-diphosphate-sugar epimerase